MITTETDVLDAGILACINEHLRPEDVTPNLLSLVRMGIIAHEHAFYFGRKSLKKTFLSTVEDAWQSDQEGRPSEIIHRTTYSRLLSNLSDACTTARHHAVTFPLVIKDVFLAFVSDAWDAGNHQRRVYSCEVEGSVNNEFGVALNFACGIAIFGERKGLLPEEYKNRPELTEQVKKDDHQLAVIFLSK